MKKFKRKKVLYDLNSAKTIGMVYEYKDEAEFKIVEDLIIKLRSERVDVKALVFLPYVKLLEYLPPKLSIDFIIASENH